MILYRIIGILTDLIVGLLSLWIIRKDINHLLFKDKEQSEN
jgi:hypothetical protein